MSAAKAALDQVITKWCESSGYKAKRIDWAGSSDWASFRKVLTDDQSFFVKTSTRSAKEMFQGEALGLQAMYECSSQQSSTSNSDQDGLLVIPKVHHWGDYTGGSLLIMDYLDLGGRGSDYSLGKAMARLHLASANEANGNPKGAFGFAIDNTIGGTPQPNPWTKGGTTEDWIEFYKKHRMEHQLQLAGDASCSKLWDDHIAPRMHLLFEGMTIKPSLLHGDLWR
jgi:protein-ribulosamine 3-kinase